MQKATVKYGAAQVVDRLLEATVVGSFSEIGFAVRRRVESWDDPPRLDGKVMVVTGASSGIGRAAAVQLAGLGARVWLVGRDQARLAAVQDTVSHLDHAGAVEIASLDLVDTPAVQSFAAHVLSSVDRLDGLVHGAGALFRDYRTTDAGVELTVATHVLAPFQLTSRLSPLLRATPDSVIVTVSSGGMYTQRFDLDELEMDPEHYRGVRAYARAKRAQVVLAHEWAQRWSSDGVSSYAMHPGWVDTPGLTEGLPGFRLLGPLLRDADQGADTVVWLAAGGPRQQLDTSSQADSAMRANGFWHDRRRRGQYYLPSTRRSERQQLTDGARLWAWCAARDDQTTS